MLGNMVTAEARDIVRHSLNCDQISAAEESDGIHALAIGSTLTGLNALAPESA